MKGRKQIPIQVMEILKNPNTPNTYYAKLYKVDLKAIAQIKQGKTWKHLHKKCSNNVVTVVTNKELANDR